SGDLDGDGVPDLVTANKAGASISILRGNGDGSFSDHQDLALPGRARSVVLREIKGDGKLDVVAGSELSDGTGAISIFLNQGGGVLGPRTDFSVPSSLVSTTVADLDRDGHLDIVAALDGQLAILRGDGAGGFAPPDLIPVNL